MSSVVALTVDGSPSNHLLTVDLVAVIGDDRGRVLLTHAGYPDVWSLPGAPLEPGLTPHESLRKAGAIDDWETGEVMGVWSLAFPPANKSLGSVSGVGPSEKRLPKARLPKERLLVAYRFRGGADEPRSGSYFPIGLAPLNSEPSHLAIAAAAAAGTKTLSDRLELPTGIDHLASLRRDEVPPEFRSARAPSLFDSVSGSQHGHSNGEGPLKGPRALEVFIATCQGTQVDGEVLRSILASEEVDEATLLRCELRLEEIESVHGVFPIAWSRLSASTGSANTGSATNGNGGRFLDLILAQIGYASLRRGRRREADAYLRRALAVCEVPHRRAAIKYSLSWRSAAFVATG